MRSNVASVALICLTVKGRLLNVMREV